MLNAAVAPQFQAPDLLSELGSLPVTVQLSPAVLSILVALGAVFVAALSVMLVYHWRRFPYEHDLFRRVESLYLTGVALLLGVALVGIIIVS
jgi:hypothetical protein